MPGIFSHQRNFPWVSTSKLWLLLVIALVGFAVDVPAEEHLRFATASLTAPAVASDLIATPTEKPKVKNIAPAPLSAVPPSGTALPLRGHLFLSLNRLDSSLLPHAAPPAAPSLPRPPPSSCC